MVSHKAGTRAAKGGRGMGRCATPQGERVVETEGELLDALEEPARTAPLDPMEVLTHSVEDLDCRVAELDRQMLVVAQRADGGYAASAKLAKVELGLADLDRRQGLAVAAAVLSATVAVMVLLLSVCGAI